jgi:hypothetical protein
MTIQRLRLPLLRWVSAGLGLVAGMACTGVLAQTVRLDDSASPRALVQPLAALDETGRPLAQSPEPNQAVLQFGDVRFKLRTAPYVGKSGRIYMVFPSQLGEVHSGAVRLRWQDAQSRSGVLSPGERALVWSGRMDAPWTDLMIRMSLELNLALWRSASSGVSPFFELELAP